MNIVILGASKGLGRQLALDLASENVNLFLIARSKNILDKFRQDHKSCQKIYTYELDLSMLADIDKVTSDIMAIAKSIDIVFNVVGPDYIGPFELAECKDIIYMLEAYVKGQILFYKKILPALRKSLNSHIFNFSVSWAVDRSGTESGNALFTSIKSIMIKFFNCLEAEEWQNGLAVTNLHLGELQSTEEALEFDERRNHKAILYKDLLGLIKVLLNSHSLRAMDITIVPKERGYARKNQHYSGELYDIAIDEF